MSVIIAYLAATTDPLWRVDVGVQLVPDRTGRVLATERLANNTRTSKTLLVNVGNISFIITRLVIVTY